MNVLLVDNYDSFTFNLAQGLEQLGARVEVIRADDPRLDDALAAWRVPLGGSRVPLGGSRVPLGGSVDRVVVSPGPGRPEVAGRSPRIVREAPEAGIPTLGVCLGLQCAAVAFGAAVVRAPEPRHGKTSLVHHDGSGIFAGVRDPTEATRYHSLMVDERTLPLDLVVTARSDDGVVMGLRHRTLPLEVVQFHPESVLTADGPAMLRNFLERPWATGPRDRPWT